MNSEVWIARVLLPKLKWHWNIHQFKMYFLLKMGTFQLAMFVFRGSRVVIPLNICLGLQGGPLPVKLLVTPYLMAL